MPVPFTNWGQLGLYDAGLKGITAVLGLLANTHAQCTHWWCRQPDQPFNLLAEIWYSPTAPDQCFPMDCITAEICAVRDVADDNSSASFSRPLHKLFIQCTALELVQEAIRRSAVSREDGLNLHRTDFVLQGVSLEGTEVYVVGEASITIADHDVDRARERAGILATITGADVLAAVIGTCPASTIFTGWRQSVLPVHLLGLDALLGSVGPVAGDVKLQDDGVVHDPVNRRGGGHGVGKDALPLREDQV